MSAPIGPGDWVECRPLFWREKPDFVTCAGPWPVPGGIYVAREVGFKPGWDNEPAIRLVGIVASYPGHPDCWWPTKHFRPIYRPKADLIESLKAHPKRVSEPA